MERRPDPVYSQIQETEHKADIHCEHLEDRAKLCNTGVENTGREDPW
jgi:hypothetical protein